MPTTESKTQFPIVGAFYRPPAQAILSVLAVDTKLTLLAEPENAYDANAIAVWLDPKDIAEGAYAALSEKLNDCGWALTQVLEAEALQLGYIAKNFAAQLKASGAVIDDTPLDVTYGVNASGEPRVRFAVAPY